jgi:hypothetical protein
MPCNCYSKYKDHPPLSIHGNPTLFRSSLLLEQLLNQLLFLDEECSYNSILDTVCATGASVGTLDGFLVLGEAGVFARAEGRDLSLARYL